VNRKMKAREEKRNELHNGYEDKKKKKEKTAKERVATDFKNTRGTGLGQTPDSKARGMGRATWYRCAKRRGGLQAFLTEASPETQ